MKIHVLRLMIVVTMVSLAGCSLGISGPASGPLFTSAPNSSNRGTVVYLYRPYVFKGGGSAPYVYIDNDKVVLLKNNGYTHRLLDAGQHTLQIKKSPYYIGSEVSYEFEILKDKKEAYIRIVIPGTTIGDLVLFGGGAVVGALIPGVRSGVPNSDYTGNIVPEAKALEEIHECRYIKPEINSD